MHNLHFWIISFPHLTSQESRKCSGTPHSIPLPPVIHRPFIENHSIVQTTKFSKAAVQRCKCRWCHAAEAPLEFLKTSIGRLQNTRNTSKTLSNCSGKVSPWDNTDSIISPKILQATYWEIRKLLKRVSLKCTVQFTAILTIEGHGGFNPTGNTGGKSTESLRPNNFNHRIIFALLWANFPPAASRQVPVQTAGTMQSTFLAFPVLPSAG